MKTKNVTRTVVCRTESSHTKVERLRPFVEEWQRVARGVAERISSYPKYQWGNLQNPTLYRNTIDVAGDDAMGYAGNLQEAGNKAMEAFGSYKERGCDGERPIGEFGNALYMRVRGDYFEIVCNDRGYGAKVKLKPYGDPLWLHLDTYNYHEEFFDRVADENDDARTGTAEVHIEDDDSITLHVTVSWEVDVHEVGDVEHYVGVDLGENVIHTTAVVDGDGGVEHVEMESGAEFRHYREKFDEKRDHFQEQGKLADVDRISGERLRYTKQVADTVSKRIVEIAGEHDPAVIVLEDLTHYRSGKGGKEAIHDWPYALVQEKISYKATEAGIPVTDVNPSMTSQTCRKCQSTDATRDGHEFVCHDCGYEVHADVNAAINIANRYRNS